MRNNVIAIMVWAAAVALSLWGYPQLPDQVAIHWGPSGQPDDYSSREFAVFFMPVLMILMFFLIRVLPKIDPKKKNYPRFQGSLDIIMLATLLLLLVVHGMVIGTGLGYDIPMMVVVPLMIGALFVVIGNVMPRFRYNYFVGIRTPWTLSNEQVWTKSHAASGKIFFFGGLILMACALIPGSYMVPVMIVILVVIPVSTLIVSYYYFKNP